MRKVTEDPEGRIEWSRYWIEKGLRAVEKRLEKTAGTYCVGDDLTFADCCLVPQIYNANRYHIYQSRHSFNNYRRTVAINNAHLFN